MSSDCEMQTRLIALRHLLRKKLITEEKYRNAVLQVIRIDGNE